MKAEDIDELFKLMERMMNGQYAGGAYMKQPLLDDDFDEDDPIDITEDEKYIYITVELRGIQKEDFNVLVEPYAVILEVFSEGKWYSDKFNLPHKVKRKAKVEFNNCILDVILTKDKEKNGKIKKGKSGKSRGNNGGINGKESPEVA